MLDPALKGRQSAPVVTEVEKGAIRRFAEAIGDDNPAYYGENPVAPPTFCFYFRGGPIPGLELPTQGIIHGEQHWEYFAPIRAGDRITVVGTLLDFYEREGKRGGKMLFVVRENTGRNQDGALCFKTRSVSIVREQVWEAWKEGKR